jgi:hypothetical protein
MTWPMSTCVRPLFVFFVVKTEAYMLQIRYLINYYLRIEVRKIRTMKLMHDIYRAKATIPFLPKATILFLPLPHILNPTNNPKPK